MPRREGNGPGSWRLRTAVGGMGVSAVILYVDLLGGVPDLLRELAFANALINLMNLLPFWVLDGGRIAACSNRRQILMLGLFVGALGLFPFSPYALLMAGGFLLRACFWQEFETLRPGRQDARRDRGRDMLRVLGVLLAMIVGCCWMIKALHP